MANQLNESNVAEFIGQLVDGLEDRLEAKGVTPDMLPNEDRDKEDEDAAIIYGKDYDIIDEAARCEIDMCSLVETDTVVDNAYTRSIIVMHIYDDGYRPILDKIRGLNWTNEDISCMRQYLYDTFRNWGLFT